MTNYAELIKEAEKWAFYLVCDPEGNPWSPTSCASVLRCLAAALRECAPLDGEGK